MSASAGDISNPFKGSSIFIDPATNFFTIHISGNLSDGCKWFYVGPATWAMIGSNHLAAQQGGAIYIHNTGNSLGAIFRRGAIQANSVTGTNTTNIENDFGAVHIESGWGVDISGNVINNAFKTGIYNKAPSSVINGNQIKNASFISSGGYYIRSSGNNTQILSNTITNLSQGPGTPAAALRLETFTVVDNNRIFGEFDTVWDTSSRGEGLIYGEMKEVAEPSIEYGFSAPLDGRYIRGSIVYHRQPRAGGNIGWVCIGGGTPGVWRAFGEIEV